MITLRSDGHEIKFTTSKFPDGTSQVWQLDPEVKYTYNKINFVWENDESEILHLLQLVDLLRGLNPKAYIYLDIPYLPYARQDKPVSNNTTFALHTFANLLNSKNINLVTSFDVHSKLAGRLINNFQSVSAGEFQNWACNTYKPDVIFYPDEGAAKRYSKGINEISLYGVKVRNQLTGAIEGYSINNVHLFPVRNKRVLIIDDICDGGATFITAAKVLYEHGASDVALCVSHGIFSKGLTALNDAGINDFYTTNSLLKNADAYPVFE